MDCIKSHLKTPAIAATNAAPPAAGRDAHAAADQSGHFILAHDKVGGTNVMVWIWSTSMNKFIRAFPIGMFEIIAENTLMKYKVPSRSRIYIQTGDACNVYLGGILDRAWGTYGMPG